MEKPYIDLLIVLPLEEEASEFFSLCTIKKTVEISNLLFSELELGADSISGVTVQMPKMGNQEAYLAATIALQNYKIGVIVCVGIAGALSKDLLLGDVCYTGTVFDLHERQKVTDRPRGRGSKTAFSPEVYKTPTALECKLTFIRTDETQKRTIYGDWQSACSEHMRKLREKHPFLRAGDTRFRETPLSKNGKIACGAVSASKQYNNQIKEMDRAILAIETESVGIFKAAAEHDETPALTIRGISDFADAQKVKFESELKNIARSVAAHNATGFLMAQLRNPYFRNFLSRRQSQVLYGGTSDLFPNAPLNNLVENALDQSSAIIDSNLRDLCPEYKLVPKGYVLPAPRLRPILIEEEPSPPTLPNYLELQDTLINDRIVFVDIPRSYPDQSSPWVLAETLRTAVINERQALPIVIRGDSIAPPGSGLDQLATHDLNQLHSNQSVQLIFLIYKFDTKSRSKRAFIAAEIDKYPNARFAFLTRGEGSLLVENELVQQLAARAYAISQVPFIAIANFVQRNFHMAAGEAEVVAYRLSNIFEQFDLFAHPTYFAGIPTETVVALSQANRRSELIQLAVDGYLTFVVAGDQSDVSLSRTTRRRFLGDLAIELEVEKKSFTQAEIISYAKIFADLHDFEIDPLKFVNTFVDKGILRFEGAHVEFTLPFIQYYLLALKLSQDEELAKRYFLQSADDFDFETFDLYAEIGPSRAIVDEIFNRISQHISSLSESNLEPGVFLTDELKPSLLSKYEHISDIRAGLHRAVNDLQQKSHDGKGKQRVIDIGTQTTKRVNKRRQRAECGNSSKSSTPFNALAKARHDWKIGGVMLGSAAEHLLGEKKQELVSKLISLSSLIVDIQTRRNATVNFGEIKKEMLASAETAELLAEYEGEEERQNLHDHLSNLFDLLELSVLGQPLISTLNHLCEQSRHKVLASSIAKANVIGKQENVIKATWLADLAPQKGVPDLRKAVIQLPPAPFLRILLASHFLHRVYWAHWRPDDRRSMLDAARETIKAMGISVNGEKLLRLIEHDEKRSQRKTDD